MRAASLTLVTRIVLFVLSICTNIILARSLGASGRGVYALAILIPSIVVLLAGLGIGPANVFFLSRGELDMEEAVGGSLLIALAAGVIGYGALVVLIVASGGHRLVGVGAPLVLLTASSLPFTIAGAYMQGVMQGEGRFVEFNATQLGRYAALLCGLVLVLVLARDRLEGAVFAWTASSILYGLLAIALVVRRTSITARIHLATIQKLFRFGLLVHLGTLSSFVNYRADVLLVGIFAGARATGLYAVATSMAEVIWFVPNAAAIGLAPTATAAGEAESAQVSAGVSRVVLGVAAFSAGALAIAAPFLVPFAFGGDYVDSVQAVWLLLPGMVTFAGWKILSAYLVGRGLVKRDLLAAVAAVVVTLSLDIALVPRFGFRAAALVSSVAYTLAFLIDLWWIRAGSAGPLRTWLVLGSSDIRLLWDRLRSLLGGPGLDRKPRRPT